MRAKRQSRFNCTDYELPGRTGIKLHVKHKIITQK